MELIRRSNYQAQKEQPPKTPAGHDVSISGEKLEKAEVTKIFFSIIIIWQFSNLVFLLGPAERADVGIKPGTAVVALSCLFRCYYRFQRLPNSGFSEGLL